MQPRRGGGMTKRKDPAGRAIHSFRRRWTLTGSIAYGTQAGGLKVKIASNSLRLRGPYVPRNSPGQNTGVGSLSLLQGIFPIQESNRGLLHCRWILYQMSHQGRGTGMSIKHPSGFWIQGRREFSAGWALPEGVLRGIGGSGRTEPRSSPKLACKPVLWRVSSVYRKEHLFPLILWKATCAASPCQHPNPWGAKDRSWCLFQAPTKVPLSPAAALPAHYREHTDSRHPAVAPRLYVPQRQQLQGSPAPARAPHHTCALVLLLCSWSGNPSTPRCRGLRQGANHSSHLCLPSTPQEEPHLPWVSALVTSRTGYPHVSDSCTHTGAHLQRSGVNYRDLVQKLWCWLGGKVGS